MSTHKKFYDQIRRDYAADPQRVERSRAVMAEAMINPRNLPELQMKAAKAFIMISYVKHQPKEDS